MTRAKAQEFATDYLSVATYPINDDILLRVIDALQAFRESTLEAMSTDEFLMLCDMAAQET